MPWTQSHQRPLNEAQGYHHPGEGGRILPPRRTCWQVPAKPAELTSSQVQAEGPVNREVKAGPVPAAGPGGNLGRPIPAEREAITITPRSWNRSPHFRFHSMENA